jgi:hypothetical protein
MRIIDFNLKKDEISAKCIALQATPKLIYHCLKQGWTPQSGCWTVNIASVGLAKKLGFEPIGSVNAIFVVFN